MAIPAANGTLPQLFVPQTQPKKEPGTEASQDLLLTLDLVERSAIHPVPVPLTSCFG